MKAFTILAATTLLISALPQPTTAQEPPTQGLLAYYPFDGNANDESGNGLDGTPFNGVSYVPRLSGSAADFNGNSQYVFLPAGISNYQDLTVSFWIKTGSSTANTFNQGIFLVSRDVPYLAYDWNICLGLGRKVEFHTGTTTTDSLVLDSGDDLASNEWTLVTCVADSMSGTKKIYLNGIENASVGWVPHPFANNGAPILVGAASGSPELHPYFVGDMDELRFYNRALSPSEVQQLYNPCSPHAATATAIMVNGFVVGATLVDGGCGYTEPPAVVVRGGGGTGATAYAEISNGSVTNIVITSAGHGYTNTPVIVIGSPPFTPWLTVAVGAVKVVQHVVLGRTYVLESSFDMLDWVTQTTFTAETEVVTNLFNVDQTGSFYRIRQVAP